jgi:hypothetical protein
MKERPILFSGPMVRAILEGRKTQTRRVIKLPDYFSEPEWAEDGYAGLKVEWSDNVADAEPDDVTEDTPNLPAGWFVHSEEPEDGWAGVRCPYGQPGDRLWLRENFLVQPGLWAQGHGPQPVHYEATTPDRRQVEDYVCKPSIHMPRWASRITLEVTEVRVQRLRDLSEADAEAEGVQRSMMPPHEDMEFRAAFSTLWDSINGQREGCAWKDNPWVWAVSFKRVP